MGIYLKNNLYLIATALWLSGVFFVGCEMEMTIEEDEEERAEAIRVINNWIFDYMDLAYFWNQEMPYKGIGDELESEEYFETLLKKPDDKWSFITDDAEALFNYFDGVIKSMGYSIQLYYLEENSRQVVAIVEYVYPNSPASDAQLERGDVFTRIDGVIITDENYQRLLSKSEMTITLASLTNQGVEERPNTIYLKAIELNTDPVIVNRVLDIEGTKIGYLAYTSFIEKYNSSLVSAFTEFKSASVNDLVLDLRYNGGGSVESAQLLSELIVPSSAVGNIFINEVWNDNLKEFNYALKIKKHATNLNLNRVFILTTEATASASEMVIYGLEPYMEVIQIGEKTHGKYFGSITIVADERNKHNWAMQPIVMRAENKNNSINYKDGLPPTYKIRDNIYNAPLGDPNENFLSIAIGLIINNQFTAPLQLKSTSIQKRISQFKDWDDPLRTMMRTRNKEE